MSLVTGGLGVGALVVGGLGFGGVPPVPPEPIPVVQPASGGGGSGNEFDVYSVDRAIWGPDDGVIYEPEEYFAPGGPSSEYTTDSATDEPPSPVEQFARAARFWVRAHPGRMRGATIHVGGATDAGKVTEHWAVTELRTAGGIDAGKVHETWDSPDEFTTAGATDGGKVKEKW